MVNFMKDLRADPRYKTALVVFMVESNLTMIGVSHFFKYVDEFTPIWKVCRQTRSGEITNGVLTTHSTKEMMITHGYGLLRDDRIRLEARMIGRNLAETLSNLKKELRSMLITETQKDDKVKWVMSGKASGPDDLATCLLLCIVKRLETMIDPQLAKHVPSLFRPCYFAAKK